MAESQASIPETHDVTPPSFRHRTLRGAWRAIAGVARGKSADIAPELPPGNIPLLRKQIRECVEVRGGEVSTRARAAALGATYLSLSKDGHRGFLEVLADETEIEPGPVKEAISGLEAATDRHSRQQAERVLRVALRSPRIKLYRRFTALPQGVKCLIDLRADLLGFRREEASLDVREGSSFDVLEDELESLLTSWFDVGFLELKRIEWDSPASLLEKLIDYEAVHQIQGWDDHRDRHHAVRAPWLQRRHDEGARQSRRRQ